MSSYDIHSHKLNISSTHDDVKHHLEHELSSHGAHSLFERVQKEGKQTIMVGGKKYDLTHNPDDNTIDVHHVHSH
jgi:hypothetical protein